MQFKLMNNIMLKLDLVLYAITAECHSSYKATAKK